MMPGFFVMFIIKHIHKQSNCRWICYTTNIIFSAFVQHKLVSNRFTPKKGKNKLNNTSEKGFSSKCLPPANTCISKITYHWRIQFELPTLFIIHTNTLEISLPLSLESKKITQLSYTYSIHICSHQSMKY